MRFTVGQKYWFIYIEFKMGRTRLYHLYQPWLGDSEAIIHLLPLTCTRHEKVAWNQDPKQIKNYDGFVFVDDQQREWHNQYPGAAYGQTSTEADWLVKINHDYWLEHSSAIAKEDNFRYTYVPEYLSIVDRGVHHYMLYNCQTEIDALTQHIGQIIHDLDERGVDVNQYGDIGSKLFQLVQRPATIPTKEITQ